LQGLSKTVEIGLRVPRKIDLPMAQTPEISWEILNKNGFILNKFELIEVLLRYTHLRISRCYWKPLANPQSQRDQWAPRKIGVAAPIQIWSATGADVDVEE